MLVATEGIKDRQIHWVGRASVGGSRTSDARRKMTGRGGGCGPVGGGSYVCRQTGGCWERGERGQTPRRGTGRVGGAEAGPGEGGKLD